MGSRKNTSAANRFRPGLAALEDRTAPAAHTWITNGAGLWSDPANWAGGDIPDSGEAAPITVNFATPAVITVVGVDPNLQLDGILFSAGGTILNLTTPLRLTTANFVETITANSTGNQINGTAALTFLGNGDHDLRVGAGNVLLINAPVVGANGIVKTGDGTVQLAGNNTLAGTFRAADGTTILTGTTDLATLRVGDGNVNDDTPSVIVAAGSTPSVDVLRVEADGTVTINNNAVLTADSITLGTANGGGTVTGAGTLRFGLGTFTVATSADASEVSSRLEFASPFDPVVDVPDATAGVDLIVSGVVGGINGFTKTGAGIMRLGGAQPNTLNDPIRVANGTLEIGGAAGVTAVAGDLQVVGQLDQPPAVVRQLFSNVVANTSDVTVGFLGTYNLNNLVESVEFLTVEDGGLVQVGTGVLSTQDTITLTDGDITMAATGILIPAQNIVVNPDGVATTSQISGGRIDLSGGRTVNTTGNAVLTVTSALTDGTLTKVGTGELLLAGTATQPAAVVATAGTLTIGGARPNTTVSVFEGAFLRGAAGTDDITMTDGRFQPGDSQGNGFFSTSLTATDAAELVYAVFSPTESNQLTVSGDVTLAGVFLTFISLADVPLGTTYTFLNKTSPGAINGIFTGVPEGGTVIDAGAAYRISYVGGDGNDVTVTRVIGTTTALVPSVTSAPVGEAVGVVATVTAADNSVPTGSVRFFVDEVAVGDAPLNAAGQAAFVLPFLNVGDRAVSAQYLGIATLGGSSTENKVSVTVRSAASALSANFAAGAGEGGKVRLFNADNSEKANLSPFAGFAGGVRTAVADFTGDGVPDLAVGAGPGSAPRIQVIDGKTNQVILDKLAFEAAFTGGVYLAAGDLTGDGKADLVITPDEGGGPRVTVLQGGDFAQVANFFGIDDPNFRGGARAAVGDLNRDGRADLIVNAGFGGGPRVAGFDGRTLGGTPAKLFNDFFLFEQALRNGAFATVGDINGDGYGDLIGGGGPGGGPRVLALSGVDVIASKGGDSAVVANFFAGNEANRGGVRVSAKNLDGDLFADLVVGDGSGAGSRVTGYSGAALKGGSTTPAFAFDAFAGSLGGVFVG